MQIKKNKISIIMSTYNDIEYIAQAIESVIKQTYKNWELIIINDASTDGAEKVILNYVNRDRRIIYIKNKINLGITTNLNKGLQIAKGDFVAILDGDDIWLNANKLKLQLEYLLENPQVALVGTWGYMFSSEVSTTKKLQYPTEYKQIKNYLLIENCFIHSSVMYRRKNILVIGGYNQSFGLALDYELWLRLARNTEVHNLSEFMVGYRINELGVTSKKHNRQIDDTILALHANKNHYPFFLPSLSLWYLRKFIPRSLRINISKGVRKVLFFN